jgi:hypothetical protein
MVIGLATSAVCYPPCTPDPPDPCFCYILRKYPSLFYECTANNCFGYAFSESEGDIPLSIGSYNQAIKFWTDGAWSNDGLPSYIALSGTDTLDATHVVYYTSSIDTPAHAARVIQNDYPKPIIAGYEDYIYVSQFSCEGLYQHNANNKYKSRQRTYFKLKTEHSGTLKKYDGYSITRKTWIGAGGITHTVTGTVTVPEDVILYIKPGATVEFASGASLIVDGGTLIAEGTVDNPITFTRSGSSGSWGAIVLNGSGAAGSSLKYVNMQYGTNIQVGNTSNVIINHLTMQNCSGIQVINSSSNITVKNSSVKNCTNGISFTSSTGSVLNDTISYITYNGITVQNASTVTCNENKIKNCSRGIYYTGGSQRDIGENDIAYCSYGMYIANCSNIKFKNVNPVINNRITNTTWCGIYISNSRPYFYDGMYAFGYNSIYDNDEYDLIYVNGGGYTIDAIGTYWEGGDPANAIIQQSVPNSPLVTSPYLSTNPWEGIPLPKQNAESFSIIAEPLYDGLHFQGDNNFSEAKNFFVSYLKDNPDDFRAQVELYNCYNKATAKEIINYFEKLPGNATEQKFLLSYLYLKQGMMKSAKELNEKIVSQNRNTEFETRGKLNNFYITLHNNNDPVSAASILNDLLGKKDSPMISDILYAKHVLETYVDPGTGINPDFDAGVCSDEFVADKTIECKLLQNYPNPFNPETVIEYFLPTDGFVSLKIYDILGKEVASLVNEEKTAGSYMVNFNGDYLSSGVYFYQLKYGTLVESKKMILLR